MLTRLHAQLLTHKDCEYIKKAPAVNIKHPYALVSWQCATAANRLILICRAINVPTLIELNQKQSTGRDFHY